MKKTLQESTLFHKYAARKNVYKLRMCCHEKILSDAYVFCVDIIGVFISRTS